MHTFPVSFTENLVDRIDTRRSEFPPAIGTSSVWLHVRLSNSISRSRQALSNKYASLFVYTRTRSHIATLIGEKGER